MDLAEMELMKNERLKTKIIELLNEQPRLSQKLTKKWLNSPKGLSKLGDLSRVIGKDEALLMMDWIQPEIWEKSSKSFTTQSDPASVAQEFIQGIAALELTWEETHEEEEDPFEFLKKLDPSVITSLANRFQADEWCLISAYWSREDSFDFARHLSPKDRRAFVVAMERMKKIPQDSLRTTARSFANRVNLALEKFENVQTEPAVTYTTETVQQDEIDEAIEQFSIIQKKEREIENQVTEYLSGVDPELCAKVDQILNADLNQEIIEVET